MNEDLKDWRGREAPAPVVLEGRFVRLEPIDVAKHGRDLAALDREDGARLYRYLPEEAPTSEEASLALIERYQSDSTNRHYAVIDAATGRAEGRQAFYRITPEHGSIEMAAVLWGPRLSRTRLSTEAFYLFARYVFDDLRYRRCEWKCNALNEASRRAALRFGFTYEGTFRQHMVRKGENRNTDWFSIIDGEWPSRKAALEAWLALENFDANGVQRQPLAAFQGWRPKP